jgi:hypothetical protein
MRYVSRSRRALIRLAGLAIASLGFTGCPEATTNAPECGTDVPHVTHDGSTIVFGITSLTIDPNDSPNVPHTGFDIDGFASDEADPGGCVHQDFLSVLDPESNCSSVHNEHCAATSLRCSCATMLDFTRPDGGREPSCFGSVDNQLPTVATTITQVLGTDLRASISGDVARGRLVVIARITGIDAFDEDPEVHVQLLNGFAAPGTACTTPMLGGRYQIDRDSLRAGGTTEADGAVDLTGSIHGGRLRAAGTDTEAFTIAFPLADHRFRFELRHPIVAADLGAEGAVRGNFGGWVDGDALATEFAQIAPSAADAIRMVVGQLVDIRLNDVCEDRTVTPSRLGGMSFGMGFELTRVAIDPTNPVVDAPAAGTCLAASDGG